MIAKKVFFEIPILQAKGNWVSKIILGRLLINDLQCITFTESLIQQYLFQNRMD